MQIWKVNSNKWRHNHVITKTMTKFGPPRNPLNYISFESRLTTGIEKCSFYWIWATMSKVMGIFCQILAFLTMPAHQIWSCHVPQEANFENFHFVLILHLILGSHKYSSGKAPYFKSYQPKTSRGGGGGGGRTPPTAFRVNSRNEKSLHRKWQSATNVHIIPDGSDTMWTMLVEIEVDCTRPAISLIFFSKAT